MRTIHYLSKEHLDDYWEQIKGYIDAGLFYSEGEITLDQIRLLIVQGAVHVIIGMDTEDDRVVGALAFEIRTYPNYRAANIISLGGDHLFLNENDLIHLREELRKGGIKRIEGWCKPAQARTFRMKLGAETPYQMIRINLEDIA